MEPEDTYPGDDAPDEQQGLRPMSRALFINLVIVLIYTGLLVAVEGRIEGLFVAGLTMQAQAAVNLVVMIGMFVMRKKEWGMSLLLSALILGVVGFSTCVAAFQ